MQELQRSVPHPSEGWDSCGSPPATIRQRDGILAVRLQPLVNLVKVDNPSLAGFGAGDFPVREFLIDGRKGNVGVLVNLLWRDRAVSVLSLC